MYDLSYSSLINGLNKADIDIDRKILADLAMMILRLLQQLQKRRNHTASSLMSVEKLKTELEKVLDKHSVHKKKSRTMRI